MFVYLELLNFINIQFSACDCIILFFRFILLEREGLIFSVRTIKTSQDGKLASFILLVVIELNFSVVVDIIDIENCVHYIR